MLSRRRGSCATQRLPTEGERVWDVTAQPSTGLGRFHFMPQRPNLLDSVNNPVPIASDYPAMRQLSLNNKYRIY